MKPSHREICEQLGYAPDPDRPGRLIRTETAEDRFLDVYGRIEAWIDEHGHARIGLELRNLHRNLSGNAHGGFLLALVDHALFVGPALLGIEGAVGGVTMDVSAQFLAPAVVDARVEAAVEVLRETHRTLFVRGTLEQSGEPVVAFSGMVRKASARS